MAVVINGKTYPILSRIIEKKGDYIGGELVDDGDDTNFLGITMKTKIVDIVLRPNGTDSAWFEIVGEKFGCGFDTEHGGIDASGASGSWLAFRGPLDHKFKIRKPAK